MFFSPPNMFPLLIFGSILISLGKCQYPYKFPNGFNFGVGTSAFQIEGAWNESGKGVSNWDQITHDTPQFIFDGSNADVACDSYHQWERDIEMIKETGVNFYRFSISWTRIFPSGYTNYENPAGVAYYNNLINKLLENGIEPVVTLFHWDMPQNFRVLGSWNTPELVVLFNYYAKRAFQLFGDRVKTWITINQPKILCMDFNGFLGAVTNPYPTGIVEYLCAYHMLKAHAAAYRTYQSGFRAKQRGRVSLSLNIEWTEPASNSRADIEAAEERRLFEFGLFAHPLVYGDFPPSVERRIATRSRLQNYPESRLPRLTLSDKLSIWRSFDFLGISHYLVWLVKAVPEKPLTERNWDAEVGNEKSLDPSWESTGAGWNKVTPWALRKSLKWIKDNYLNPEIFLTEIGYPDTTGTLDDDPRINYYQLYLNATLQSIKEDRVRVSGLTAWSLMDNFEWQQGYTVKFGLFHVDFNNPARPRTAKKSVNFIKSVVETRQIQ